MEFSVKKKLLNILCSEININLLNNTTCDEINKDFFKIFYYINLFSKYMFIYNLKGDKKYIYDARWLLVKLIRELDEEVAFYIIKCIKPFNYKMNHSSNFINLIPPISDDYYIILHTRFNYIYDKLMNYFIEASYNKSLKSDEKWILMRWIFKANLTLEKLNAVFNFNQKKLPIYKTITDTNILLSTFKKIPLEWIPVAGGFITYGHPLKNCYNDDTQLPSGNYFIKSLWMTKNTITVNQYLRFIYDDGYKKQKYWNKQGWIWLKENKIILPYNWKYESDKITINGEYINYYLNHPVSNISWWEADAFARWSNGRLPTEWEWEWVATNRNTTPFPHGLQKSDNILYNLNCVTQNIRTNKISYNSDSLLGFNNLFGNVWEWCNSNYEPYSGWKNDPFNNSEFKINKNSKVVKGGSWMTFDCILSSQTRWGIHPSCRYYPTGFRIIKNN